MQNGSQIGFSVKGPEMTPGRGRVQSHFKAKRTSNWKTVHAQKMKAIKYCTNEVIEFKI